jgi:Family of unknown function (DUF6455)
MRILILSKEATMPNRDIQEPSHPVVEQMLNSIAGWVTRYRKVLGRTNDLGQCSRDEVMQIAKDLGVSANELRELVAKGPHAADLVQKMLVALNVDPKAIANSNPLVMRDLQRLCINCNDKKRCASELNKGTAAEHFHEFCPNALTLDALFEEKLERRVGNRHH